MGVLAYVLSGLSFIPLIGVPFGIGAIVYGATKRREGGVPLIIAGAAGIGLTIVLYGSLFYFGFVQRGGVYDDLRIRMARTQLNTAVRELEYYRLQHGTYPAKLDAIEGKKGDTFVFVHEPFAGFGRPAGELFVYEVIDGGAHYHLFSRGPDGVPGTADDIFPDLSPDEQAKIGYRKVPAASPDARVATGANASDHK